MSQPLTPIALAALLGIALAELTPISAILLIVCGVFSLGFTLLSPRFRPLGILITTTITAALHLINSLELPPHDDIRKLAPNLPAIVAVRGELLESPTQHRSDREGSSQIHTTTRLGLSEFRIDDRWIPASGQLHISTRGALSREFFRSQRVEIDGVLQLPRGSEGPGLFDLAATLRFQECHRQLLAEGPADWRLAPNARSQPPISERFLDWGRTVLAQGLPSDDPSVELLWAMTLGWRAGLSDELQAPFLQSGTIHVFAISGLHIALICLVFISILRLARLQRAACGLLALPLAWIYVAMTGWQSSAIRSALMTSIVIVGWALHRPSPLMNSLAGSALAILAWQPGQLFLPGFQLSFGVVGCMAALGPFFQQSWIRWTSTDPQIPEELRSKWERWRRWIVDWLGLNLSSSAAAWAGSWPLVWHWFHLLNPVSLVANLIVIPLSSAALIATLGSLLCGHWLPALGSLFNASAWVWMTWMVRCSEWFAEIPCGWWHVGTVPVSFWTGYYTALFLTCLPSRHSPAWERTRIGAWILWIAAFGLWKGVDQSKTRLVFLPGGAGIWVDLPGTHRDTLVNGGNASTTRYLTIPFLHTQGIDTLSQWLLTQGQVQSIGGALLIRSNLHPQNIQYPRNLGRLLVSKRIMEPETRRPGGRSPPLCLERGTQWNHWRLMHPGSGDSLRGLDDTAGVLLGEFEGVRILYCGNLGRRGQRILLEREIENLGADIVVSGIPNDGEPLMDPLLDAVRPGWILLTNSDYPANRRVRPETLERLKARGCRVSTSGESGMITLELSQGKFRVRSHKDSGEFVGDPSMGKLSRNSLKDRQEGLDK